MATCDCRPVRLKSSSINSSETSAKYSWPNSEQKDEIHDSGVPEEVDMMAGWCRSLCALSQEDLIRLFIDVEILRLLEGLLSSTDY